MERTEPGLEARGNASLYSVLAYSRHTRESSVPPPAQSRPVMSTPGKAMVSPWSEFTVDVDVKVRVQLQ